MVCRCITNHDHGGPLVLVHDGGSTIQTTFGSVLETLATFFRVIAVELQVHGRIQDIDRGLSFEQDASDIAEHLRNLDINSTNVLGSSNGAYTALQTVIWHATAVRRIVVAHAFYNKAGRT